MKAKVLNIGLILSSFLGYLEWGADQSEFLIQTEWQILSSIIDDPTSFLHPLIIVPLLGQVLLFITLFQKNPNSKLTYLGLGCLALLLLFILFIGFTSLNLMIIASILPFVIFGVLTIRHHQKMRLIVRK